MLQGPTSDMIECSRCSQVFPRDQWAGHKCTRTRDPLLIEREQTHGDFRLTAKVANDIREAAFWGPREIKDTQREALTMIATKIARIMCGDPNAREHWDDIAGYAKLGAEACDA